MDEKTSKDAIARNESIPQTKETELVEAANPGEAPRRQAAGVNIVQNPLMVSLSISDP
jgi:hypothetical protein